MSRTNIRLVSSDGTMVFGEEFHNSYGSAMYIWRQIANRHLTIDDIPEAERSNIREFMHITRLLDGSPERATIWDAMYIKGVTGPLWDLFTSECVPDFARMVLATTFDGAIVTRQDFAQLANDFDRFVAEYPNSDHVCTLPAQAEYLRSLSDNESVRGACWDQTSVADDYWLVYGDDDESRSFNVDTDDRGRAFLLYDRETI